MKTINQTSYEKLEHKVSRNISNVPNKSFDNKIDPMLAAKVVQSYILPMFSSRRRGSTIPSQTNKNNKITSQTDNSSGKPITGDK